MTYSRIVLNILNLNQCLLVITNSRPSATPTWQTSTSERGMILQLVRLLKSCDGKDDIVVNDLLYFLSNKVHVHPTALLKECILSFYREDEIFAAKSALLCAVGTNCSSVQTFAKKRIGDNKLKASVDDIFHIWYAVDEAGTTEQLPTFCSATAARVPVIQDELSDIAFMRYTISNLSTQVSDLAATVNKIGTTVQSVLQSVQSESVKTQLEHLNGILEHVVQHGSRVTTVRASDRDQLLIAHDSIAGEPVATDSYLNGFKEDTSGQTLNDNSASFSLYDNTRTKDIDWPTLPPPSQASMTFNRNSSRPSSNVVAKDARNGAVDNDGNGPFKLVTAKKKSTGKIVVGKRAQSTPFTGVVKKVVFCLSRLEPGTPVSTVQEYLTSQGIHVISCFALQPRDTNSVAENRADRPQLASMRLTVPSTEVAKIMSGDLWPEGVSIRKWTFKNRQASALGS